MSAADRLQKVQEIFHAAVALEPANRAGFLSEACASDRDLLAEIESLIDAHEREGSFIDSPAGSAISELGSAQTVNHIGQVIGSYRILALLGRGGMGEVYLAEDSKLGRKIALKLLLGEFTKNEDLIRRFTQEAKAASALNHPNIVTVYEIGQTNSTEYIATEYIEGETLRSHLAKTRMELREILDIVIQLAGALSAAHTAGIIHRDIKPENVMLRPDGYAKILDFGLAKLTSVRAPGSSPPAADLEAATLVRMETEPGMMLGTPFYMSPEQARGLNVDARADIFSLGVMTYEMLSGHRPFVGDTNLDVLISTIEKEPRPLAHYVPETPSELQRIVNRTLCKDRDERYQTAKDLWIDLKNLRDEVAFEAKRERSGVPEHQGVSDATTLIQKSAVTDAALGTATAATRKSWRKRSVISACAVAVIGIVAAKLWLSPAPLRPAVERTLNYFVMVQKYRDGKPFEAPFRLPGEINFENGYRVRLHFSSPQDGHLYIFNEGPSTSENALPLNVLFPSPTANDGLSLVPANSTIEIPKQSWFRFDAASGTEKVWIVWSATSIADLEKTKMFVNEKDLGAISDAGVDRAVKNFLSSSRSSSNPTIERDDSKRETHVKASGDIVIHVLALEHH
jgi:serine/threonine protein kinase